MKGELQRLGLGDGGRFSPSGLSNSLISVWDSSVGARFLWTTWW